MLFCVTVSGWSTVARAQKTSQQAQSVCVTGWLACVSRSSMLAFTPSGACTKDACCTHIADGNMSCTSRSQQAVAASWSPWLLVSFISVCVYTAQDAGAFSVSMQEAATHRHHDQQCIHTNCITLKIFRVLKPSGLYLTKLMPDTHS